MSSENGNLVSLENWKRAKKDATFCEYLKVLNFNDLVNESNELIVQIKKDGAASELLHKTKLMMNEFALRLEKESKSLAESVLEIKKSLENNTDQSNDKETK